MLRCRRNPRLLRQRVARPGAERAGRERRVERPLRRRARSAGRSPVGSSSWASPAGTLAVGTCGAHGAGPLGGGMKVTSLDGRQLRKMLRKEAAARCVVLDCRPYLAFAASSVRGSLNVNLNSVVSRLLQEGGGGVAAVVVLDQGSRHWQKLREESAARVVLTSLLACLPAGPRVYFLKGELRRSRGSLVTPPRQDGPGLWGPLLAPAPSSILAPGKFCTLGLDVRREGHGRCQRSQLLRPHLCSSKAFNGLGARGGGVDARCWGRCFLAVRERPARAGFPGVGFMSFAGAGALEPS